MHRFGPIQSNAAITAIGSYVPDRIMTNAEMESIVDTNDEWIVQRTGIKERRAAAEHQYCSDLCIEAVNDLQQRYNKDLHDVDFIITATSTPEMPFPNVSARVQAAFGIKGAGAVDLTAACAGFVYALQMANGLLLTGLHRKILVIGAEVLTKITDYTDRTTCILFGDGAGAVLVEAAQPGEQGAFLGSLTSTEGELAHHLYLSNACPTLNGQQVQPTGKIVQNGREVYKWAVSRVSEGAVKLLSSCGFNPHTIDWFVPHSANLRMLESICDRTDITLKKTLHSIALCGNTSAASIPLALDPAVKDGRVQTGQHLLLYGFGGGLTQAGLIVRWML